MATQHVAFWPSMVDLLRTVGRLVVEMMAAPKAASVANILSVVPGRIAVPKSRDVPAGEERVSFAAGQPSCTGSRERKPVLFFIGSPLTGVMSMV